MTNQVLFGNRRRVGTQYGKRTMISGTDASGGYLVDDQLRSLITVLVENTLALQNVPAYTVQGDPVDFPGQSTKVTPTWKSETGAADESNPTFLQVSFTAKRLTVRSEISRTVLIQSSPDVEAYGAKRHRHRTRESVRYRHVLRTWHDIVCRPYRRR